VLAALRGDRYMVDAYPPADEGGRVAAEAFA
jgi:hypothetical protein